MRATSRKVLGRYVAAGAVGLAVWAAAWLVLPEPGWWPVRIAATCLGVIAWRETCTRGS